MEPMARLTLALLLLLVVFCYSGMYWSFAMFISFSFSVLHLYCDHQTPATIFQTKNSATQRSISFPWPFPSNYDSCQFLQWFLVLYAKFFCVKKIFTTCRLVFLYISGERGNRFEQDRFSSCLCSIRMSRLWSLSLNYAEIGIVQIHYGYWNIFSKFVCFLQGFQKSRLHSVASVSRKVGGTGMPGEQDRERNK